MDLLSVISDKTNYQIIYKHGLEAMLKQTDELGVFILVLANSTYDSALFEEFKPSLEQRFGEIEKQFLATNDHSALGAPDDVAVFEQLMDIGFDSLEVNQKKYLNQWELQFNPLRSLRPARNSQNKISQIKQIFNRQGFHFNKPFLVKEELWSGDYMQYPCRLLYNKFPFADYHTLLVIDSVSERPQWIEKENFELIWKLAEEAPDDFIIAYNSIGAMASINHQHFQCSVNQQKNFCIERKNWEHNGGLDVYPLGCEVGDNIQEAWKMIDRCQQSNTAFNCLLKQQKLYLVKRAKQGDFKHQSWTSGFGWAEIFGSFSINEANQFSQMNEMDLQQEFKIIKI